MIVFEDKCADVINELPDLTVESTTKAIHFNWGTEEVLAKYLTLSQNKNFPLIWLVEGVDTNDLREPSVTRNARFIILHESQVPNEFNPYQHEYDYRLILQPICNNLLTAFLMSGISRYDNTEFKTQRVKNYSMRTESDSLVYICNAIVLDVELTFSGVSSCIQTIDFNN